MKQKFTLLLMAFFATSAFAANNQWKAEAEDDGQEKILFENGVTYTDNQEFTTENVKFQLGNVAKWKKNEAKSFKGDYLMPLSQKIMVENSDTGEMEEKNRIIHVVGSNNPKDDIENKNDKGGFNGSSEIGKLPQSGTYYMVTPSKDGAVLMGIVLNAEKEFFIVDATNAEQTPVLDADGNETGNYTMNVVNSEAVFPHDAFNICMEDGTELAYTDEAPSDGNGMYDGGKGGIKIVEKITGTVEFEAVANHTYYVFCTGSKLTCFGLIFTPAGSSQEETYAVNVNAENGQVVLEKTSYKAGEKVYVDVIPDAGYEMAGISIVNDTTGEEVAPVTEGDGDNEKHYFVMPASSVTITAVFEKLYNVILAETQNGSVTVISVNMQDDPYAKKGKKICMMVKPQDDYEIQEVTVKTADNQNVDVFAETGTEHQQEYNYYFVMPENDVTITATFQVIDGINNVSTVQQNGSWYNLQGVEVQKPVKGVYINNGKKVIVK